MPPVWNDYANEVSRLPLLTMLMEMSRPPESIKAFLRHLILGYLIDVLCGRCACVSRVSRFVQCPNRCIAPQGICDVAIYQVQQVSAQLMLFHSGMVLFSGLGIAL